MNFTKNKLVLITTLVLSFNICANETNNTRANGAWNAIDEKNKVTAPKSDLDVVLENNPNVDASKFLDPNVINGLYSRQRIRTGNGFVLEEPMTLKDAASLNHPYFKDLLEQMDGKSLSELAQLETNKEFAKLRVNSIYNEGLKFGTQSALYQSLYEFQLDLREIGDDLDRLFDFNMFMLAGGRVRPPVIVVKGASVEKESEYDLRTTNRSITILKQAGVVTRAPNFIDYLNFNPIKPAAPQSLLLPRKNNAEEISAWNEGVKQGWLLGVKQGNAIINEGLFSLYRDFEGMGNFFIASKEGMISMPEYQSMNLGVTTDGTRLNIGEETFSISILPEFNNNARKWQPLPRVENFLKLD